MTLTSVAPVISDAGIEAPTYYEIVDYLKTKFREIYGEDAYLENDSMDGQWIGVNARAIADVNASMVNLYSTFSPKTASGDALTRNVAINGIERALATYSTVDLILIGIAGIVIKNGTAKDSNNNIWNLPESVVIPNSGSIVVTATCAKAGTVLAMANTITTIGKPTRGWTSVNNVAASSLGMDLESDTKLRQRQALSVAIPSQSKTDSIKGAIFSLSGVSRCKTYENTSKEPDSKGIPAHSLCVVVSGGDANEIAQVMRAKKSLGCGWYGNTQITVINNFAEEESVSFYRPDIKAISFNISIQAMSEYTQDIGILIKEAIADYVNRLDIGDKVTLNKIYIPAGLYGNLDSQTYEIAHITILVDGVAITGDYALAFNAVAHCDFQEIEINVVAG